MCGLTGIYSYSNNDPLEISKPLLRRMRDTMVHRGPDADGMWVSPDKKVGLGFRRLSIVDLTPEANQPMATADNAIQLVFNGEVYNHAEIRRELEELGVRGWKTDHSDSEVVLRAFEYWGIDCVERFRGMFGIAIWDSRSRELWLVRDRMGIKPLYYSMGGGRVAFASEIKAILEIPGQRRAMDEEAFFHYLSFLTSPAPKTLFDGIHKLKAGTWLRINAHGNVREHRYWDVWDHTRPLAGVSEAEIAQQLQDELRNSVTLRKRGDVPMGVFLSGGLDSSTNAAMFSEGARDPVNTFTIGYQGEYGSYQNEIHHAKTMAEVAGANYHEHLLTMDHLLEFLPRMVQLQDEPIADPVCVPVHYVSKLARDHGVTVCQVGEGADELFWGYPHWKRFLRLQQLDGLPVPNFLKKLGLAGIRLAGKQDTKYYEWLRRASIGKPVFWGGAEAFTESEKQRLLAPRLRSVFGERSSWEVIEPIWQHFQDKAWEKSSLNWMSYLDLNMRLPELLLMRVDKMSMGVSLETRVPFLDHKVVELAMSIPTEVKTRNGNLKHILKRSVRGVVPDPIIDRKKQGFGVPVHEWCFDRLGTKIRTELLEFCERTDFLDVDEVTRRLESRKQSYNSTSQIWYLLNLALWWKAYMTPAQDREDGGALAA